MKFNLSKLFAKKLIIVSGKGGVGKTTVSLALALLAAEQGKKTLLAEINSEGQVSQLLNEDIGYPEREVLPHLWAINISPKLSFEEYVLMQIKFKGLYKAVFENKFVRYFIEAIPGLGDLMSIGKIYASVNNYDLIVVDAPATGHGVSLLQVPSIVASAVKVGPLKTHSDGIDRLLHDENKTQIVLVTLPEEMPVTEALEMSAQLQKMALPLELLLLNQFRTSPLTTDEAEEFGSLPVGSPQGKAMSLELARADLSELYLNQLKNALPEVPLVKIPFLYTPEFKLAEVQVVADALAKELL